MASLAETIMQSHTATFKCEVLDPFRSVIAELDISGGRIQTDTNNNNRTTGRLTIADPDLALNTADVNELLHPLSGNFIRPYRQGVLQGTLLVTSYNIREDTENLSIDVSLSDYSHRLGRQRFTEKFQIEIGDYYTDAIKAVIQDVDSEARFIFPELIYLTPNLTFDSSTSNRWDACVDMAESFGHKLYYDERGVVVLKREPNPDRQSVVWKFEPNEFNIMTQASKQLEDTDVYNVVVVSGENTDNDDPVVYVAEDDDPNSPTYINGPLGRIPDYISSQYVTSMEQAEELAYARLRQVAGVPEDVTIECVPHPGLRADDLVEVRTEAGKIDGKYLVESTTLPMEPGGTMSLSLKTKRVLNG